MKPSILVATKGSGSWDAELWAERIRLLLPQHTTLTTNHKGIYEGQEAPLRDVHYVLVWKPKQETLDRLPALRAIFPLAPGSTISSHCRACRMCRSRGSSTVI